jgi:ABC-type transport system substrate-binding protein
LALVGLLVLSLALALGLGRAAPTGAAASDEVRIFLGTPSTLDPAIQGDIGSAAFTAQLFETLTAFDSNLALRPALAESWTVTADGRRVTFHLRDGLSFSDGSPIGADDVVRSWLRLLDPARPSPLASLILDVEGAFEHLTGTKTNPADVGLHAEGRDVVVDLIRPGADFPAIIAGPSFAIVPKDFRDPLGTRDFTWVGSGGYNLESVGTDELLLRANEHYWAGTPAIQQVRLLTSIGGRSPVAAFEAGDVDYAGVTAFDAAWLAYDEVLGPQLRQVPSLSLTYVGFNAGKPPFDDVRVRRAFSAAVDWRRISELGAGALSVPVTSMVPPGIPGAPDGDFVPAHDPAAARQWLADAGYPGGAGFPVVEFAPYGAPASIARELETELGVTVKLVEFDDHFGRLIADPPGMFGVGWIADYPGPNDFLGVLLRTGSSNNYGRWSSATFDAAIDDALGTADPGAIEAGWRRALEIIRDDVPAVPLVTGDGWALSRAGLLGAGQNGLGLLRVAGMAWQQ